MTEPLRVLLVEDSPTDAKLVIAALRATGLKVDFERVEEAAAMRAALAARVWDIVLSDWQMPSFSAVAALEVLKETGLDLPFIIVSGTVGEELAVDAMRAGAHDYVLKDKLGRLAPAIEREIRDSRERASQRESEARNAAIVRSSHDAIVGTDHTGRVLEWNPAAERCFGYTQAEAIGRYLDDLVVPDRFRAGFRAGLAAQIAAGHSEVVEKPREVTARRKDGTEFPIERLTARLDGRSPPIIMGFIRDLTDRMTAEAARREAELRLTRLADSGLVGITIGDASGAILDANDTFLRMVGRSRDELLAGAVDWVRMTAPESAFTSDTVRNELRAHGFAGPLEKAYVREDGTSVPVLIGVATLDERRNILLSIDLTDRKRAEEGRLRAEAALRETEAQLRQAQKMEAVGRLAGGVAHDFNNVLSVIMSHADLIYGTLDPSEPRAADIDEIRRASARAADLTRQLLLFSRQQVVEPRVIDLHALLTAMGRMLARVLGEDIELVVDAPAAVGRVRADPNHVEQVILNLVVNARDAMPTGGRLMIEIRDVVLDEDYTGKHVVAKTGPHVLLAVSDTGCGMDRETQARIFEPFFTTKELGKGTGLGLSTVFGIVQASAGTIWVYSEVGRGTTFKIYLPRVDAEVQAPAPAISLKTLHGRETILVVEDEEQVRAVVVVVLRRQGYHVLTANDPTEGLRVCETHEGTIHLLLTDVVMPHMSGPELARRVAATRPETRILCMSGYTDDSIVRHGVLDSTMAFIQKPVTPTSLARKVREVLDADRASEPSLP